MDLEPAYLAGVLDSDGSISIIKRKKQSTIHGFHYRAIFQLSWTKTPISEQILTALQKNYGGQVNEVKNRWNNFPNTKNTLKYSIEGLKLERLLTDIAPFVKLKKEQVVLALKLRFLRKEWRTLQTRTKPEEFWNKEHEIYNRFKEINTKNGH